MANFRLPHRTNRVKSRTAVITRIKGLKVKKPILIHISWNGLVSWEAAHCYVDMYPQDRETPQKLLSEVIASRFLLFLREEHRLGNSLKEDLKVMKRYLKV
jgi:hypothetical protein